MLLATYQESFVGEPDQRRCSILTLPAFERVLPIPFSLGCRAIFSHDSKHLVLYLTRDLIFWSISEQKVVWRVPEKTILQLACSPDNTLIATALSDRRIVIRNSHDGSIKLELTHHRELLQCMTFTPDSKTLITITLDGRLKFSQISTGQELFELELKSEIHRTSIVEGGAYAQLNFSEDGHRLFCHLQDNDGPRDTPDEILVFDASDPAIENK